MQQRSMHIRPCSVSSERVLYNPYFSLIQVRFRWQVSTFISEFLAALLCYAVVFGATFFTIFNAVSAYASALYHSPQQYIFILPLPLWCCIRFLTPRRSDASILYCVFWCYGSTLDSSRRCSIPMSYRSLMLPFYAVLQSPSPRSAFTLTCHLLRSPCILIRGPRLLTVIFQFFTAATPVLPPLLTPTGHA